MNKKSLNDLYGLSVYYADTDAVITPKTTNYSLGYIKYFKREWEAITGKLRRYPKVMSIPLVPEDRSHEKKIKRVKF